MYPWSIRLVHETLCERIFTELKVTIPWEKRPDAPRQECWMMQGDLRPYTYGKPDHARTYEARGMPKLVKQLATATQQILFDYVGKREPEGCFANFYTDHRDHLGWHADNSLMIDHSCPVVSVSFGQPRKIHFRKNDHTELQELLMEDGSITVMPPGYQQTHQHKIPKGDRVMTPRISLTYRWLA